MNYLVLLDGDSPAGSLYTNQANGSGTVNGKRFLLLSCRSINFQTPGFVHVDQRLPRTDPTTYRGITFPSSAVLFVAELESDDINAFGFAAT